MRTLLLAVLLLPVLALSQPCFSPGCGGEVCVGPGPCGPVNPGPVGPTELCLPEGCALVAYAWHGDMALAGAQLPNGYPLLGWAGPCLSADRAQCPNIFIQAFDDLRTNALRANRAQRFAP